MTNQTSKGLLQRMREIAAELRGLELRLSWVMRDNAESAKKLASFPSDFAQRVEQLERTS